MSNKIDLAALHGIVEEVPEPTWQEALGIPQGSDGGEALRALRLRYQRQLPRHVGNIENFAKEFGVSFKDLSEMERGLKEIPVPLAKKFAKFFKTSPLVFLQKQS